MAAEIFDAGRVFKIQEGLYAVESQRKVDEYYRVSLLERSCDCHDFVHRKPDSCKHIMAAQLHWVEEMQMKTMLSRLRNCH